MAISVLLAAKLTETLHLGFRANADDVGSFLQLMIGVAILGFLNATLGSLLKLLTLPLSCLTLGLFSLVINAVVLQMAGQLKFGFHADNFWAAFVGSVLISAINGVLGAMLIPDKEK